MLREKWHESHHLYEAWFWVIIAVPAFIWWKDSIWFVIVVSLYANYKTAIGAHEGRQARRNTEDNKEGG